MKDSSHSRDAELATLKARVDSGELCVERALLCAYIAGRHPIAPTAAEADRETATQLGQWRDELAALPRCDRDAHQSEIVLSVLAEILVRLRWGE